MAKNYNKPIRVSKKILDLLKQKKDKQKLKSYDAVLERLLKREAKIKKAKLNVADAGFI